MHPFQYSNLVIFDQLFLEQYLNTMINNGIIGLVYLNIHPNDHNFAAIDIMLREISGQCEKLEIVPSQTALYI